MAQHDGKDSHQCRQMLDLLKGQSRVPKAAWSTTETVNPRIEVGTNNHELHNKVAKNLKQF